jgi:hypothetical protein
VTAPRGRGRSPEDRRRRAVSPGAGDRHRTTGAAWNRARPDDVRLGRPRRRLTASLRRVVVAAVAAPGCAAQDAVDVGEARALLIGLPADDLRLCAGVPDRRETSKAGEFWSYDRALPASGVSVPVPVAGGNVSVSGAGFCRATFQLVRGRVARISLGGTTEMGLARDAACAPIVQQCLRLVREHGAGGAE